MPLAALPLDLEGRLFGILLGLGVGTVVTWTVARWRIHSARGSVLKGDARDTVVIEHHIVERRAGPTGQPVPARLRTRYLGQAAVSGVIPNAHLAAELHKRADAVGEQAAMISMEGATGSYLLETLCGFVCDRVANAPFPHGLYVMAPIREPAKLAYHKPISVMLVALDDLPLFSRWEDVAGIETERGTDGVRVLTLLDLARALAASVLALSAKEGDKDVQAALLTALGDEEPVVKRAVALAMARLKGPGAADNIASALSFDKGKDGLLTLGLLTALDRLGQPGIAAFLSLADSGAQKDIDKVAELYPCLRSAAAFAALPGLLRNPHMVAAQRETLVRAGASFLLDPPQPFDAAAKEVMGAKKEVEPVKAGLLVALSIPGVTAGKTVAAWAVECMGEEDESVRLAAIAAVGNLRAEKGGEALLARLEKGIEEKEKTAIARALGGFPGAKSEGALIKLLDAEPEVRRAALMSLPVEKAAAQARKMLSSDDDAERKAGAASLVRTSSVAIELAKLLLAGKVKESIRPEVLAGLRRHAPKDAEAMKLLQQLSR